MKTALCWFALVSISVAGPLDPAPKTALTAIGIAQDFTANPLAAKVKHSGHPLTFGMSVSAIAADPPRLLYKYPKLPLVICNLAPSAVAAAAKLKNGEWVAVTGNYAESDMDSVTINDCTFQTRAEFRK